MDIHEYLKKMRGIQKYIIEYLEIEDVSKDNYQSINIFFQNQKLKENKHDFKEFIHFISKISENHQRKPFFFEKIEQILIIFKEEIHQNFTNLELFNYFIHNKRILLFLFQYSQIQNILNVFIHIIYSMKYQLF